MSDADRNAVLDELVAMSQYLGAPERPYVILGEGNCAAAIDTETFFVKASGTCMGTVRRDEFVEVRRATVLELLEGSDVDDVAVERTLLDARCDHTVEERPSVETLLHAILLGLAGVGFVAHTHPVAVNSVMCSAGTVEAVSGSLFPDQIVYCGPRPLFVPYVDPGIPLAREINRRISTFREEEGMVPRVILMQNHGLIALGQTSRAVINATEMCEKAFRILLGTYALGGPNFFSDRELKRIHTRPDEAYRKKRIEQNGQATSDA